MYVELARGRWVDGRMDGYREEDDEGSQPGARANTHAAQAAKRNMEGGQGGG